MFWSIESCFTDSWYEHLQIVDTQQIRQFHSSYCIWKAIFGDVLKLIGYKNLTIFQIKSTIWIYGMYGYIWSSIIA